MKTNIKIAIRGIVKSKKISLISVVGLGIGLGCVMLLLSMAIHEHSFDRFIPNNERAYRVILGETCALPYQLGSSVKNDIPGIEDYFRFYQAGEVEIKDKSEQKTNENFFGFSDPSIFNKLGIDLLYGKPALLDNEMAISESMAKKYFNRENVVGEIMTMKLNNDYTDIAITGVYKDFPLNSTLSPNFIAAIDFSKTLLNAPEQVLGDYAYSQDEYKSWNNNFYYTYLFLEKGISPESISEKMGDYIAMLDQNKWGNKSFKLQPVSEIYHHSNDINGNAYSRFGNINDLKYYTGIALIILCIAIINYIFLTRAKILGRLKEMGAKKALGATKSTIRQQVLSESNLVSLLSFIPALAIILLGIPFINNTLGKELNLQVFSSWQTWVVFILIILVTGSISGLLIGNSISLISPVLLLSGQSAQKRKSINWRNSFLIFHFTIFIVLLVSVLTFKKQLSYSLTNFKNINPDNVLICELNTPELKKHFEVIKNDVSKNPDVIKVAGSTLIPPTNWFLPVRLKNDDKEIEFDGLIMGEGMIELLEMQMIEGESFGEYQQNVLIINESTAKKHNIKAGDLLNDIQVKGIVKDFMAHTLYEPIKPMVILQQHPEKNRLMALKTTGNNIEGIKADIFRSMKEISPEASINIRFMKDEINQFYSREQNQAKLIGIFSLLAIILAIMGLFGIVLVSVSKRIKEIGIRKINGANIPEVFGLLNWDFIKWVIIAIIISTPISWLVMKKWLENFAFKTDISWWIFAIAGALAVGIALLTVSWQSWRAAKQNPVESLRYE